MKASAQAPSHVGFLRHRRFRDLKIASIVCVLCIVAYFVHDPVDGPNGGTWLGYGLGTLGALIILVLAWMGIRKRRYRGGLGTVRGWLSAHVYFGLALVTIGTLHAGFQFGWNVHTLAYVLMLLVVGSGIFGIAVYASFPELITGNRRGETREAMLAEIEELNQQALGLADELGTDIHQVVVRSVERIRIGGGVVAQLFGPREPERRSLDSLEKTLATRVNALTETIERRNAGQSTVKFLAGRIAKAAEDEEGEARRIQQLLDTLGQRKSLVARVNRDVILHARLQIWLYVHVPLTLALLAALITHVVAVFLYW